MHAAPIAESRPPIGQLQLAHNGAGELLQRDYWAAIENCRVAPAELMAGLRERFCEFPPPELVKFSRIGDCEKPLAVGDEFDVAIRLVVECRVRVVSLETRSVTLATLSGHPEAGRITFGSYRHEDGKVMFHIRSRSRSGSATFAAGYFAVGEAMQTNTWSQFVETVAFTYGDGVAGEIHAETECVEPKSDDEDARTPTFDAQGDD